MDSIKNNFLKVFIFFALFSLFLLIVLSFFAYPQADDFGFANSLNNFGWLGSQINWYKNWFGRFASTMLIISGAYINFGILCKVFPLLVIGGYFYAFYLVSGKFFADAPKKFRLVFAITIMFVFVSGMPSLSQGVYWFSGTATYSLANIAVLIFISLFDSIQKNKIYILLILLGIFIIGSNEAAMLVLMLFVGAKLLRDRKNKRLWSMLAVFTLFSLVVVLAPGNTVRSEIFAGKNHNILFSLAATSGLLGTLFVTWLFNPFFWIGMLIFSHFDFKVKLPPIFVILFMLFLVFCTIFPSFWATGLPAPERNINMTFLLFLFLSLCLISLNKIKLFFHGLMEKKILLISLFSVWILADFYISSFDMPEKHEMSFYLKNPGETVKYVFANYGQNNFYHVYTDLFSGRAADYRKTMLDREEKIKNYKVGLLCLPKVEKLPKSIVFKDLFEDPEQWENKGFAEYYSLEQVAVCKESRQN